MGVAKYAAGTMPVSPTLPPLPVMPNAASVERVGSTSSSECGKIAVRLPSTVVLVTVVTAAGFQNIELMDAPGAAMPAKLDPCP